MLKHAVALILSLTVAACQTTAPFAEGFRDDEPQRIAESNGFAQRDGGRLLLNFAGTSAVQFKDHATKNCAPNSGCHIWTYYGMWFLKASPDGKTEPYALINWYPGEGGKTIIVDKDGHLFWLESNAAHSPDGRYVTDSVIDAVHEPAQFHLIDWASPDHATAWKTPFPCEFPEWTSPSSFYVACENTNLDARSFAEVKLMPDGSWKLRELGALPKDTVILNEFIASGAKVVAMPERHLREVTLAPIRLDGRPSWPASEIYPDIMKSVEVVTR